MIYKIEILKSEDTTNQHLKDIKDKSVVELNSYSINSEKILTTMSVPREVHNIPKEVLGELENSLKDEIIFSYTTKTTIRIKKSIT